MPRLQRGRRGGRKRMSGAQAFVVRVLQACWQGCQGTNVELEDRPHQQRHVPALASQFSSFDEYFSGLMRLVLVEAVDTIKVLQQKALRRLRLPQPKRRSQTSRGGGSQGVRGAVGRRRVGRTTKDMFVFDLSLQTWKMHDSSSVIPPAPRSTPLASASGSRGASMPRVPLSGRQRAEATRNARLVRNSSSELDRCCYATLKFKAVALNQIRQFTESHFSDGVSPTSPGFAFLLKRGSSDNMDLGRLDCWFLAMVGGHYTDLPWVEVDAFIIAPASSEPFEIDEPWQAMPLASVLPLQRQYSACYNHPVLPFGHQLLGHRAPTRLTFDSSDSDDDDDDDAKHSVSASGDVSRKAQVQSVGGSNQQINFEAESLRALNGSQRTAILDFIQSDRQLHLLQGPPGSGKTRAIVALLNCLGKAAGNSLTNAQSELQSPQLPACSLSESFGSKQELCVDSAHETNSVVKTPVSSDSVDGGQGCPGPVFRSLFLGEEIPDCIGVTDFNSSQQKSQVKIDNVDTEGDVLQAMRLNGQQKCDTTVAKHPTIPVSISSSPATQNIGGGGDAPDQSNHQVNRATQQFVGRNTVCAPSNKAVVSVLEQYLRSMMKCARATFPIDQEGVHIHARCCSVCQAVYSLESARIWDTVTACQPVIALTGMEALLKCQQSVGQSQNDDQSAIHPAMPTNILPVSLVEEVYVHGFTAQAIAKVNAFESQLQACVAFAFGNHHQHRTSKTQNRQRKGKFQNYCSCDCNFLKRVFEELSSANLSAASQNVVSVISTVFSSRLVQIADRLHRRAPHFYQNHLVGPIELLREFLRMLPTTLKIDHHGAPTHTSNSMMATIIETLHRYIERFRDALAEGARPGRVLNKCGTEDWLVNELIGCADVVFSTLSVAGRGSLRASLKSGGGVDALIVDEAAQATEAEIIVALQLQPSRCLLVGDPYQLSSVVQSQRAEVAGLGRSMMHRLMVECGHHFSMLDQQYRMHPEISCFPRNQFYGGKLHDAPRLAKLRAWAPVTSFLGPCSFVDVNNAREQRQSGHSDGSYFNPTEAAWVVRLLWHLRHEGGVSDLQHKAVVITFYAAQRTHIMQQLRTFGRGISKIPVHSVDSFQGSEADIVIVSFVRANEGSRIGFLSEFRRLNVGLTRARKGLICVGNARTLRGSEAKTRGSALQADVLPPVSHNFAKHGRNDVADLVRDFQSRGLIVGVDSHPLLKKLASACPVREPSLPRRNMAAWEAGTRLRQARKPSSATAPTCTEGFSSTDNSNRLSPSTKSHAQLDRPIAEVAPRKRQKGSPSRRSGVARSDNPASAVESRKSPRLNSDDEQEYEEMLWQAQKFWRDQHEAEEQEEQARVKKGGWQLAMLGTSMVDDW